MTCNTNTGSYGYYVEVVLSIYYLYNLMLRPKWWDEQVSLAMQQAPQT